MEVPGIFSYIHHLIGLYYPAYDEFLNRNRSIISFQIWTHLSRMIYTVNKAIEHVCVLCRT
jgi:hypothetical protein